MNSKETEKINSHTDDDDESFSSHHSNPNKTKSNEHTKKQQSHDRRHISNGYQSQSKDGQDTAIIGIGTSRSQNEQPPTSRSRSNSGVFSPMKTPSKSTSTPSRTTWECDRCTFVNEMRDRSCWMCGHKNVRSQNNAGAVSSSSSSNGSSSGNQVLSGDGNEENKDTGKSARDEARSCLTNSVVNMKDDNYFGSHSDLNATSTTDISSVPSSAIVEATTSSSSKSSKGERKKKNPDKDGQNGAVNESATKSKKRNKKPQVTEPEPLISTTEEGIPTESTEVDQLDNNSNITDKLDDGSAAQMEIVTEASPLPEADITLAVDVKIEYCKTEEIDVPSKSTDDIKVVVIGGSWECPQCTVLNSQKNKYCSICSYYNRDLVKIKQLKRKSISGESSTTSASPMVSEKKSQTSRQSLEGSSKKAKKAKAHEESTNEESECEMDTTVKEEEKSVDKLMEQDLLAQIRAEEEALKAMKSNLKPSVKKEDVEAASAKTTTRSSMENTEKHLDPKDIHTTDKQWECPHCTFMNPLSFRHCDVCTFHLPFALKPAATAGGSTPSSEVKHTQSRIASAPPISPAKKSRSSSKRPKIALTPPAPKPMASSRKRGISMMSSLRDIEENDHDDGDLQEEEESVEDIIKEPPARRSRVSKPKPVEFSVSASTSVTTTTSVKASSQSDKSVPSSSQSATNGSATGGRKRSAIKKPGVATNFANLGVKIDPNGPTDMAFKQMLYSKTFDSPPPTKRGMAIIWGCIQCSRDNLIRELQCLECGADQVAAYRYVALCTFHKALDGRRDKMKEGEEGDEAAERESKPKRRQSEPGSSRPRNAGGNSRSGARGNAGGANRRKRASLGSVSTTNTASTRLPRSNNSSGSRIHLTASGQALDEDMVELLQDLHGKRRVGRRLVSVDGEMIETSLQGNSYRPPKMGPDCQVDLSTLPRVEDYYGKESNCRAMEHDPTNNQYYSILWQPTSAMVDVFEQWEKTYADSGIDRTIIMQDVSAQELSSTWYLRSRDVCILMDEMLQQVEDRVTNVSNDKNAATDELRTTSRPLDATMQSSNIDRSSTMNQEDSDVLISTSAAEHTISFPPTSTSSCLVSSDAHILIEDHVVTNSVDIVDLRSFVKYYKHKKMEVTALQHLHSMHLNIPDAIQAVEENTLAQVGLSNMVTSHTDNDPTAGSLVDYQKVGKAIVYALVDRVEQLCGGRIFDELDEDFALNYEAFDMPIVPVPKTKPHYRKTMDLSLVELDQSDRSQLFESIVQYGGENWNRVVGAMGYKFSVAQLQDYYYTTWMCTYKFDQTEAERKHRYVKRSAALREKKMKKLIAQRQSQRAQSTQAQTGTSEVVEAVQSDCNQDLMGEEECSSIGQLICEDEERDGPSNQDFQEDEGEESQEEDLDYAEREQDESDDEDATDEMDIGDGNATFGSESGDDFQDDGTDEAEMVVDDIST